MISTLTGAKREVAHQQQGNISDVEVLLAFEGPQAE